MMDFISIPLVFAIVALGIYKLFELFVCKKERIMLIEKMGEGGAMPKFPLPKSYGNNLPFSSSALKIGCLLAGMGLGLLVGYLICCTTNPGCYPNTRYDYDDAISVIYGACVLLFGGAGLIVAFIAEVELNKKKD